MRGGPGRVRGGRGAADSGWAAAGRWSVAVAAVASLVALMAGGPAAEAVFAAACVVFPVGLIVVGAVRRGRLGRALGITTSLLLAILAASFLAMFLLRGRVAEAPWVVGLPLSTAILLGGVWLLPLALVGLAYALTFDRHGLDPSDLERLRAILALRPPSQPRPGGSDGGEPEP